MAKAQIQTSWDGDGTDAAVYKPAVLSYATATRRDVTGQQSAALKPTPNAVIFEVVASTAVLDAIDADPDHVIIWRDDV